MSTMFCRPCGKKHESISWSHRSWFHGEPDAWGCRKWFTPAVSSKDYAKIGREADAQDLKKLYNSATNDAERTAIKKSMYKITHEDNSIKSMRDSLIKATREGDHKEIKEIHEYVGEKTKKYQVHE